MGPIIIYLQGGRQKGWGGGGVMKKLEIDRGGSLFFWLIKQGGVMIFLSIHYR